MQERLRWPRLRRTPDDMQAELDRISDLINTRPRRILGWDTPTERLDAALFVRDDVDDRGRSFTDALQGAVLGPTPGNDSTVGAGQGTVGEATDAAVAPLVMLLVDTSGSMERRWRSVGLNRGPKSVRAAWNESFASGFAFANACRGELSFAPAPRLVLLTHSANGVSRWTRRH